MAEIGLMDEAGRVYFTDGDKPIANSRTLQRVMSYAAAFNALIACRPADPWLTEGAVGDVRRTGHRLGLSGAPAIAERIQLERDLALVEQTGARFLVDQISTAGALETLARARAKGSGSRCLGLDQPPVLQRDRHRRLPHLLPAGPAAARRERPSGPDRGRARRPDRRHHLGPRPGPRRGQAPPFDEAAPGAVGLETLLPAALMLHHEDGLELLDMMRPLTHGPASLLGPGGGRARQGRARRPRPVRPQRPGRHRCGEAEVQVQELALRRAYAAGQGADDGW
jgi:dihydroorotase